MYLETQHRIRQRFVQAVREVFGVEVEPPILDTPPSLELGDLSLAACFELAKKLRQAPRKIAENLLPRLAPLEGIEKVTLAGAGYLNFHLDRAHVAAALLRRGAPATATETCRPTKVLIEHTSINPNKAAHIGHLRNAVLGDTFVRLRRFRGDRVEVQNYIDNTGVQVADVVVGFMHVEKKSRAEIEKLVQDPTVRFDCFCWDLYARVTQLYDREPDTLRLRTEALGAIEEGHGEPSRIADLVSTAILRQHLETMRRINVQYDLLVQESEILRLDFWKSAFELLKRKGAIHHETAGKNAGCWVMRLEESGPDEAAGSNGEEVKIIVRSNGTVTYVGKDIAYHLWKFGLLGKDFGYSVFHKYPDGHAVWRTALDSQNGAPAFGKAAGAYSVIDTRQSYLQNVVRTAFQALGFDEQAANLHHVAYEVVGLSPRCAQEMGVQLNPEEQQRSYIEVSGRKGQGVKADDLLDLLIAKALDEVRAREMTRDPAEQEVYARMIAVAALRYFMLKVSRRMIIAFDFKDALAFEGEAGPYLQYTAVRARNIFRKFQEAHPDYGPNPAERAVQAISQGQLSGFLAGEAGLPFWELVQLAAQLEMVVEQAIATTEPAVLAKYAFRLAQAFNNFYHRFHILSETDPARQNFLLGLVHLVNQTLGQTLELMGIEIPERM